MCIICVHQCFCVWSVSCYLNLTETILCAVSYILTGPSVYRNSFQLQMKQKEQSPYSGLLNRCFVWMCVSLELWVHACEYSLQSWLFSHFTIHFFFNTSAIYKSVYGVLLHWKFYWCNTFTLLSVSSSQWVMASENHKAQLSPILSLNFV